MTPADIIHMSNTLDLVRKMRDAQKRYFATRNRTVLLEAERLEREVDAELTAEWQKELFG